MRQEQFDDVQREIFVIREPPEQRGTVRPALAGRCGSAARTSRRRSIFPCRARAPDVAAVGREQIDHRAVVVVPRRIRSRGRTVVRLANVRIGASFEQQRRRFARVAPRSGMQGGPLRPRPEGSRHSEIQQQRD